MEDQSFASTLVA